MKIHGLVLAAASLLLVACNTSGGSGGYNGGYRSGGYDDAPSVGTLGKRATPALLEGCKRRYGLGNHKYEQCLRGERHSQEALDDGCARTFPNNPKARRRCMNGE